MPHRPTLLFCLNHVNVDKTIICGIDSRLFGQHRKMQPKVLGHWCVRQGYLRRNKPNFWPGYKKIEVTHVYQMREVTKSSLVQQYLHLTRIVMPQLAQTLINKWPDEHDHCFQRIVLDAICGGVWYDHIARPAYKHLSLQQAKTAVQLCDDIISGKADIVDLNRQSLSWRGKR